MTVYKAGGRIIKGTEVWKLLWSATGDWSVLLVNGLWWDMLSWCLHWNVVVQKNVSDMDSKSRRGVRELWQLKRPCKSIIAASFLFCVVLHFMWHSFKDSVCDEYYMKLKHLSSDIISVLFFFLCCLWGFKLVSLL